MQAWVTEEMRRGFWWGKLEERNHLENLGIDGRIILKWIFKLGVRRAWTGLVWLRRETGFIKCGGICWLDGGRFAIQEVPFHGVSCHAGYLNRSSSSCL